MKLVRWFLILSAFIMVSCNDDDSISGNVETFRIESYNAIYAHFPVNTPPFPPDDNLVKFNYDSNDRIIRKTGDILYTSSNSGMSGYLSDSLFTDLEYFDNKVKLNKNISYMGYSIPAHESIVRFDINGRMELKTRAFDVNSEIRKDTTQYIYSGPNLMQFVKTYNQVADPSFDIRYSEISNIYYNGDNVDSIVTIFSRKYSDTPYTVLEKKEIEIFSNYDEADNPFRNLGLFEETFIRSLSRNNYRHYKKMVRVYIYPDFDYYQEPQIYPATEIVNRNWNLMYDATGKWIYNHIL